MWKKKKYPGKEEAERARKPSTQDIDEEPDFINGAPNYDKFESMGWDAEQTLVWLNID